MDMKQLSKKYNLSKKDYWKQKQSGRWILTHDGCTKIGHIEKVQLVDMEVVNSERDFVRVMITMKKGDVIVKTFGESDSKSTFNPYHGCMAEKRGRDRAILKLINAYEYGIYSEVEAEEFKAENEQSISVTQPHTVTEGSQQPSDSPVFLDKLSIDYILDKWDDINNAPFPSKKNRTKLKDASLDDLNWHKNNEDDKYAWYLANAKLIHNKYLKNGTQKNGVA
tara:strand:- start:1354 stop:2022 length:669 start_codon:yes stop_codon:yes gene_type:complete